MISPAAPRFCADGHLTLPADGQRPLFYNTRNQRFRPARGFDIVTPTGAKFAGHRSIFNVTIGVVKATRGLGAGERAARISSFERPRFKRTKQGPTYTAKPCIW
jgi:hypothetical protein